VAETVSDVPAYTTFFSSTSNFVWFITRKDLCDGYNSTSIRRAFDVRSTAYQRSLRSQLRNPLAAVTLTYLLGPQCSSPIVT